VISQRKAVRGAATLVSLIVGADAATGAIATAAAPFTILNHGRSGGIVLVQQRPTLIVPKVLMASPGGQVELGARIGALEALPKNSIIKLRGLPQDARLTHGYAISAGVWAVPIASLPEVQIVLPKELQGQSRITVSLVTVDGTLLAEASMSIVVTAVDLIAPAAAASVAAPPPSAPSPVPVPAPAPRRSPPAAVPAPPPAAVAPVPPAPPASPSAEDRARSAELKSRGDKSLREGGIAEARAYYERAAELGSADGAFSLAMTYDPAELKRLGAVGTWPDIALARAWYERASALGHLDAAARLTRLRRK